MLFSCSLEMFGERQNSSRSVYFASCGFASFVICLFCLMRQNRHCLSNTKIFRLVISNKKWETSVSAQKMPNGRALVFEPFWLLLPSLAPTPRPGLPSLFSVSSHFHTRKFIAGYKRFGDVTISYCDVTNPLILISLMR